MYNRRVMGEGSIFRERKRIRVSCVEWGGTMVLSSLQHQMERYHGIVLPQNRGADVGGGGSETYMVSFLQNLKSLEWPVEGYMERLNTPGRLWDHFMYWHWKVEVAVVQEWTAPLPRCDQCEIHMPEAQLFKHRQTDKWNKAMERQLRRRDVHMETRCSDMDISLYREEGDDMVEVVANFKYLGKTLDQTDDDWPVVRRNIMRTRSV